MKQTEKTRTIRRLTTRPSLFFLGGTFVLLLACAITLFLQSQQSQTTHAADLSFVTSPTLPASTVDSIFTRMGSPMVGAGKVVEQASRDYNIDDSFALAVWDIETSDGAAGVGSSYMNPGGVRSSYNYPIGAGGYTIYPSYAAGVRDWFSIVKSRYASRGLSSVYTLCVPYVGTSNAYNWAAKVTNLMYRYRGEAPPPVPTPTMAPPTPTPVPPTPVVTVSPISTAQALKKPTIVQPQIVTNVAQPVASFAQDGSQPLSAGPHSPFVFAAILLAALGIALGALLSGKRTLALPVEPSVKWNSDPIEQPAKRWSSDPITPTPAIYVNEYSPLQEMDTAPQIAAVPPTPVFTYPDPVSYPVMPRRLPAHVVVNDYSVAPLTSTVPPARAGLLKRYRLTEELERNPISAFSGMAEPTSTGSLEQNPISAFPGMAELSTSMGMVEPYAENRQSEMQPAHITEDLFFSPRPFFNVPPHKSVPEPIPVPVMAPSHARGTLLRPRRLVPLPENDV